MRVKSLRSAGVALAASLALAVVAVPGITPHGGVAFAKSNNGNHGEGNNGNHGEGNNGNGGEGNNGNGGGDNGNGGNVHSDAGALNAAHASETARLNASQNSRVGQLPEDPTLETLHDVANKADQLTQDVVDAVRGWMGLDDSSN